MSEELVEAARSVKPGAALHQAREMALQHALLPELLDLFHHPAHLLELLEQPVDLLNRGARAGSDALLAARVQQAPVAALARRHRQDDRLLALEHALVELGLV